MKCSLQIYVYLDSCHCLTFLGTEVCLMEQVHNLLSGFAFSKGIQKKNRPGLSPRLLVHRIVQLLSGILAKQNWFQMGFITCFLGWGAAGKYPLPSKGVFPWDS